MPNQLIDSRADHTGFTQFALTDNELQVRENELRFGRWGSQLQMGIERYFGFESGFVGQQMAELAAIEAQLSKLDGPWAHKFRHGQALRQSLLETINHKINSAVHSNLSTGIFTGQQSITFSFDSLIQKKRDVYNQEGTLVETFYPLNDTRKLTVSISGSSIKVTASNLEADLISTEDGMHLSMGLGKDLATLVPARRIAIRSGQNVEPYSCSNPGICLVMSGTESQVDGVQSVLASYSSTFGCEAFFAPDGHLQWLMLRGKLPQGQGFLKLAVMADGETKVLAQSKDELKAFRDGFEQLVTEEGLVLRYDNIEHLVPLWLNPGNMATSISSALHQVLDDRAIVSG
ncbi:hypothetical protein KBC79_01710 [Candidatus Woesebacteria bacterium]|nr:hypothetical protein [Candidatus Woesebacteria bacterium]